MDTQSARAHTQTDQSHCDSEGLTLVVHKQGSASGGDDQNLKETGGRHHTKNASYSKPSKTNKAPVSEAHPSLNIPRLISAAHTTEVVTVPKTVFLHTLTETVTRKGSSIFATWYDGKGEPDHVYTYKGIWNEAGAIAHILRIGLKLNKGDRLILCYKFGLQFFAAFLGCIRAGVTAVLVYPPSPSSLSKSLPKMTLVANDCDTKFILVDSDISRLRKADTINPLSKSRHLWPKDIKFKNVHLMAKSKRALASFDENSLTKVDIAFLQYTSGSTGSQKASWFRMVR